MLINSNLQHPPTPLGIPQTFGYTYFPCLRGREFDAKFLCVSPGQLYNTLSVVLHLVSCTIIPSVICITLSIVDYLVTCVTFLVSCKLQLEVVHYSVSCAGIIPSALYHSVGCMITLSVMYYSVSCVPLHQLCTIPSLVYYSQARSRGRARGKSPPPPEFWEVFFYGKVLERIHINIQTFFLGDHFLYSHDLLFDQVVILIRRKRMLVTTGA